ncbi:PR5-like receptor kinase [Corylus avellana]|uniref:PR5-like receptor kinase n=1 Tax=Corylus avellana TaxID=13451 RepID=UPI00286C04EB|nr:PR5-like receptor kinase [Corylus avellana]
MEKAKLTKEMGVGIGIMGISYFFLFLVFVVGLGEGQNGCHEFGCGGGGPAIRFPFRLNTQPHHCGYPGFTLSCTHTNDTKLELPIFAKLFVKKIDYKSQVIEVYDPDHCFPRQLQDLNLSSSPFLFKQQHQLDYALFNCSSKETQTNYAISCLGDPSHEVRAFYSHNDIKNLAIASCKKMCVLLKLKITGIFFGSFLSILVVFALYRVYSYDKAEKENQAKIKTFLEDYKNFKPTRFSYNKRITNQFVEKLGEGAYETVFKEKLSNEVHVDVKMIMNTSKENWKEFINEVGTMDMIHHVNVVRLVGLCADRFQCALVYEFLLNYSLEKFISSVDTKNRFLG